jgi:hypothetical protein
MAGLSAAAALAEVFEKVTVIDRDELPHGPEDRRGVPQGSQIHGLAVRGTQALEELLPGLRAELVAAGAPTFSPNADFSFVAAGHSIAPATTGEISILSTRPFLEGHVRRRVAALPNVELRPRCEAAGLVMEAGRVTAVTGRSARLPAWLEELGLGRPPEESLDINLTYASRRYRMSHEAIDERAIIVGPRPDRARGFALFAVEDGGWIATAACFVTARRQRPWPGSSA